MFHTDHIPNKPGCYLFKNSKGIILYVGKAKNLKKRLNSYQQKKNHDSKTISLLQQVTTVDFIITDNEVEALVLENTLIKKHQPKYNIRLKDSKGFSYIKITDEPFPRVIIARQKQGKGTFIGPFVSDAERDYILQFIQKTFQLRTCNKLPKKQCLRYHIHLCKAPCINNISQDDYLKLITHVKHILTGHISKAITSLESEMKMFADNQQFEQALERRNQIQALKHLQEKQKMEREKRFNEDIINYLIEDDSMYIMMFNIYKGTLTNKQEFMFESSEDAFEQFLIQYYTENPIPKQIIIPKKISSAFDTYFSQIKKSKVQCIVPQKGEKKQLLSLVEKNIEITFFASTKKISLLQQKLRLHEKPTVIECFDISHLSGTSMVGSMVQFRNGKPDKTNYRRFRIRSVKGIDDVSAIGEVVRRRYKRLKEERQLYPNLIIIDGGKGQLNRAINELDELGVIIPIISIAKKFEEIYIPGQLHPIRLNKKDKALQFLQEIRDEAHRFAISYNRLLRKKEMIS